MSDIQPNQFFNDNRGLDSLPQIEDIQINKLQPDYLRVQLAAISIFFILGYVAALVGYYFIEEMPLNILMIILAGWSLLFGLILFATYKEFHLRGYGIREHDMLYRDGWIWQSQIVIPFNRIQHAEIKQGPIERKFGLSKIYVFTAGGAASDLRIPGLLTKDANKIKEFLVSKAKNANIEKTPESIDSDE